MKMRAIRTGLEARMPYLFLLALSFPIPMLHRRLADEAMNTTRGALPLTPSPFLFVKWFGEFAAIIPVVLILLLFLSVKIEQLIRPTVMCRVQRSLSMTCQAHWRHTPHGLRML
jgi:hypothetical protein